MEGMRISLLCLLGVLPFATSSQLEDTFKTNISSIRNCSSTSNSCYLMKQMEKLAVVNQNQSSRSIVDLPKRRVKRKLFRPYRTGKEEALQMSRTLNWLLGEDRYNKQVRPGFGSGKPVQIIINMLINTLGPVDETTQSWRDERLSFNATGLSVAELSLDWKILTEVWKPDTFFVNGKDSKMHEITVPNRFSRLSPDGHLTFSQRLTIHATCPMKLFKFPLDSQECSLQISSYGYPGEELVYKWTDDDPVEAGPLPMSQFRFINMTMGVSLSKTNRKLEEGRRVDSVAFVKFFVERQTGYFLLQIYFPLLLMVFCSWVSFWIVKTDAPGRAALGITTVLSVAKLGFVGGFAKPEVPYATAIDTFVIICFVWVFASLIEFAIINFIGVFINRFKAWEKEQAKLKEAEKEEDRRKSNLLKGLQRKILERLNQSQVDFENWKSKANKVKASQQEDDHADDGDDVGHNKIPLQTNMKAPMAKEEVTFIDEGGEGGVEGDDRNALATPEPIPKGTKGERPLTRKSTRRQGRGRWNSSKRRSKVSFAKEEVDDDEEDEEDTVLLHDFWPFVVKWSERLFRKIGRPVPTMNIYKDTDDALENIDSFSRKYFPLSFAVVMVVYWTAYLYIFPD